MLLLPLLFSSALGVSIPQHVLDPEEASTCRPPYHSSDNETFNAQVIVNPQANLNYDADTNQWSGYLDIAPGGDKHMFFWMLESKSNPAKDPVILWLNGGPGCSSLYGLLTQWGSKILDGKGNLKKNDANLNEKATILFLDQPVNVQPNNVGFSWSYPGTAARPAPPRVETSAQAAVDVVAFLEQFRRTPFGYVPPPGGNPGKFATQDLHIAGESYAGHYIPAIGAEILRQAALQPAPSPLLRTLNVKSFIIGNPWTDATVQHPSNVDYVCDPQYGTSGKATLTAQQCADWRASLPNCLAAINTCRTNLQNGAIQTGCNLVDGQCQLTNAYNFWETKGRDMYDISVERAYAPGSARNPQEAQLPTWLASTNTRDALGVPWQGPNVVWSLINQNILTQWHNNGDWYTNARLNLDIILSDPLSTFRVLLYAGDYDFACNWIGVKNVARQIIWAGQTDFVREGNTSEDNYKKLRDAANKVFGSFFSFSRLTYARVYGAGHMVNENRPKESKKMFYDWIFNGGFSTQGEERMVEAKEQFEL